MPTRQRRTSTTVFRAPAYRSFMANYPQRAPGFCSGCAKNTRPVTESFPPLQRHPFSRPVEKVA